MSGSELSGISGIFRKLQGHFERAAQTLLFFRFWLNSVDRLFRVRARGPANQIKGTTLIRPAQCGHHLIMIMADSFVLCCMYVQ